MESIKFKTDIKCMGCVAKVTPSLNTAAGVNKWSVDVNDPAKILTISNDKVSEGDVLEAIKKAGFKAERI